MVRLSSAAADHYTTYAWACTPCRVGPPPAWLRPPFGIGFEARESEPALPPADARQTAKSRLKSSTDQVSNFPFFSNLESRCLNFSIFA